MLASFNCLEAPAPRSRAPAQIQMVPAGPWLWKTLQWSYMHRANLYFSDLLHLLDSFSTMYTWRTLFWCKVHIVAECCAGSRRCVCVVHCHSNRLFMPLSKQCFARVGEIVCYQNSHPALQLQHGTVHKLDNQYLGVNPFRYSAAGCFGTPRWVWTSHGAW